MLNKLQKPSLSNSFMITVIILSILFSCVFALIWLQSAIEQFHINAARMETDYIKSQRQQLKYEVDQAINYITYEKSRTEERLKNAIRERVYDAYSLANDIYNEYRETKSLSEIEEMVVNVLRSIRFNNGRGYYFAADINGMFKLSADSPDMEGKNSLDVKDSLGRPVVRDMIRLVKEKQEGFYQYTWSKPNTETGQFPKIAFVKYLEPFGWFIGTGEYLDDVTSDIQQEVIKRIEEIRFGKDGYVFAGTYQGLSLTRPAKNKNMWDIQDENGIKIVQELISKAKTGGGFVEYVMPRLEGLPGTPKLSYADKFDDWQWYVGAGIYVDEIAASLTRLRSELKEQVKSSLFKIGITLLGMILFSISIGIFLQRRLNMSLGSFSDFFSISSTELSKISPENLKYREFVALAESANQMVDARQAADRALRESHEWYKKILESVPSGIVVIDSNDRKIVDINPRGCEMVGLEKTAIINRLCHNFICPNEEGRCPILDLNQTADNAERLLLRNDGQKMPILKTVNRAILDGREFIIEGFLDLSDKKRLESQLQQAQKMEAIGVLAGGIAHDFNNILSAIIGYTELAILDIGAESCAGDLEEALRAALRAKDLVKQILAFSRQTDEGKVPVRVGLVVKEAIKFLRATIPSTLQVIARIDEDSGEVLASATEIHQIIINLCTNSAHAIGDRTGAIEVAVQEAIIEKLDNHYFDDLEIGRYIKISIKDTGDGISSEVMKRIFEPYFTTKEKGVGTGLGLAVVHGIVKRSGGAIRVESEAGKGTTFHIYLPRVHMSPVVQAEQKKASLGRGERILYIDDEKSLADMGQRILEQLGYKVVSRTSPIEALELFKAKPDHFDLVITDQTMPGMTGDALAEELMRVRPDIPVVLCTGYSNLMDPARARDKGIRAFLMKPVVMSDIAGVIQKVLNE